MRALFSPKPMLFSIMALLLFTGLFVTTRPWSQESAGDVARGKYLVTLAGCGDCHSPKVMTENGPAEDHARLLSGHPSSEKILGSPELISGPTWIGACNANLTAWAGPWGVSFATNLTPDKKTGMGNWNEEQFIKAMRTGRHRGIGRPILPPMPWFNLAAATDEDLKAILAYLKSIPPVVNEVPDPLPPATQK